MTVRGTIYRSIHQPRSRALNRPLRIGERRLTPVDVLDVGSEIDAGPTEEVADAGETVKPTMEPEPGSPLQLSRKKQTSKVTRARALIAEMLARAVLAKRRLVTSMSDDVHGSLRVLCDPFANLAVKGFLSMSPKNF